MTITISLIIIIITALISFMAFQNNDQLEKLMMRPYMVTHYHQYYRFITSGFVHADTPHLIFNMLTLWFFGEFIEGVFEQLFQNKLVYVAYYILGIIVADIPSYIKNRNNQYYASLGASGAISGVVFTSILIAPWQKIYVFAAIPLPAVIYGVLFLAGSAYMSRKGGSNVDHSAHFWGAIYGFVFPLVFHPELGTYFIQTLLHR